MARAKRYDESSISVLKGLEPVKQRPGMYTKTENPLHILQEVIDNSADEAIGGHATEISIECHDDKSFSVSDNGRGIPVGMHPEEKISTIELVFTRLHAGGKFNKDNNSSYNFSGGLHGVGVSVTNALSNKLEANVSRGGYRWKIVFENDPYFQQDRTLWIMHTFLMAGYEKPMAFKWGFNHRVRGKFRRQDVFERFELYIDYLYKKKKSPWSCLYYV